MKKYSIGDFARHLGVTPDFLKYYETKGVLKPQVNESGYRYYHFWERGQVLECLKLRNCGFSSREVVDLLNAASLEEYLAKLRPRQKLLQEQLRHMQAQMGAFDFLDRIAPYFDSESNWEISNEESFYFLPHSTFDRFIDSREIDEAMKSWLDWMPVVRSTISYPCIGAAGTPAREPMLGFAVPAVFAREYGLYLEAPVEFVEAQRWLIIYLKDESSRPREQETDDSQTAQSRRRQRVDIAQNIMDRHMLRPRESNYYITKLLQLRENDTQTNYSIMQIPIY